MAVESAFASGFNEAAFRDAIRQTMRMGMPPVEADRLVWRWSRQRTYAPQDTARMPYDWTQVPATDDPGNPDEEDGELVVDYALEFAGRGGGEGTAMGVFDNSRATVTLMDTEYELVKTADFATIGPNVYEIEFVAPVIGLFAVGVYQVFLKAQDES
jgi:hypothetical protein